MGDDDKSEYLDQVFGTLRSEERIYTLQLVRQENYVRGKELLDYLDSELGKDKEEMRGVMEQNHLPRMRRYGWIDYDERQRDLEDYDIISEMNPADSKDRLMLSYLEQTFGEDYELLEDFFDTFADEERRRTLYWLEEEDGRSNMDLIAYQMAIDMNESDRDKRLGEDIDYQPTGEDIENMKTNLLHRHIPKLTDLGLIEYDPGTDRVLLTSDPNRSDILLLKLLNIAYKHES